MKKTGLMFERLHPIDSANSIVFEFEGQSISAQAGDSVAAALLSHGCRSWRCSPNSGAERAAFCMMGTCYDCLVNIDGYVQQACMVKVVAGMRVKRIESKHNT